MALSLLELSIYFISSLSAAICFSFSELELDNMISSSANYYFSILIFSLSARISSLSFYGFQEGRASVSIST